MGQLEDDIARIAAKRGWKVEDIHANEAQREAESRRIPASDVAAVFSIPDTIEPVRDLAIFDQLPPASRRVLRELPLMTHALKYADLLARLRDERVLIGAVLEQATLKRGERWQPYGPDFPKPRRRG